MVIKLKVSERCGTDFHDGCENEDDECQCPCHQGRAYMAYDLKSKLGEWIGMGLLGAIFSGPAWWHGTRNGIVALLIMFGIIFCAESEGDFSWIDYGLVAAVCTAPLWWHGSIRIIIPFLSVFRPCILPTSLR